MTKKISLGLVIAFVAIFLFLATKKTLAVTITIDSFPSSINSTDPFNVNVSVTGPNPGTNYLRIDLYKEGTTNYFAETFNGNSWYGGSDGSQYFPITIVPESTVSASLQGRVGSPNSSEYPGPDSYKLRIRRYTSSGNPASGDQQTPADVEITISFSTPTPTSSPIPVPTNTPMIQPTNTPTLKTSTPTPNPTKKPTPTSTPASVSILASDSTGQILGGIATVASEQSLPTPDVLGVNTRNFSGLLPKVLIGAGFLLLLVSGVFLLLPKIKGYNRFRGKKGEEGEESSDTG